MARNREGGGSRIGAIRGRTQFRLPNGHWAKRDSETGEILSIKWDKEPYKSVVREDELTEPVQLPFPELLRAA